MLWWRYPVGNGHGLSVHDAIRLREGHAELRVKWCSAPPLGLCANRSGRRRRHQGDVADEPTTLSGEDGHEYPQTPGSISCRRDWNDSEESR